MEKMRFKPKVKGEGVKDGERVENQQRNTM